MDKLKLIASVLSQPRFKWGPVVILRGPNDRENMAREGAAKLLSDKPIYAIGTNTRDEALNVMQDFRHHELTLVTSAYHAPRAFLTWLKVLEDSGKFREIRIRNSPAPSDMSKLDSELERIEKYQAKGDCASYEAGLAYLDFWEDR